MQLREYQQRTIHQLYQWFYHNTGHPCLVLPTGAGKSHIIAALCHDAVTSWSETKILVLTHVKELIAQNSDKMRAHWPNAPMGVYSAGLGKKELGEPITFAGIQSIINRADALGHIDLVIIDEAHAVSHKNTGSYRYLISILESINPAIRIVGLTATPYRLGHGMITDKPAIFDALIEPVRIAELVHKGYLATLHSKITDTRYDLSRVHIRNGDYKEDELQAAVDKKEINDAVINDVLRLAGDRQHWLFFCTGVDHARHVCDSLNASGINSACVVGSTPKSERDRILTDFKSGKYRALTNANVLTTGFDYPDIDLIAMLRPTLSPGLYVQMAGRGMRIKSHTDHCLVLDFAGVVQRHGAITQVIPPSKAKKGGEAPTKSCPECNEIVHAATRNCPVCGFEFEVEKAHHNLKLKDDDIMGLRPMEMLVDSWAWSPHIAKTTGIEMLKVRYYSDNLSSAPITEYFPINHPGYAGQKAIREVEHIMSQSRATDHAGTFIGTANREVLNAYIRLLNIIRVPKKITYAKNGKFFKVLSREF